MTTTNPTTAAVPSTNAFKAVVRSVMPYLESAVAAAIAHFGFHATPTVVAGIIGIGGTLLTMLFHALETKYAWVGVFLGYVGAPVYAPSTKLSQAAQIAQLQAQVATFVAQQEESAAASLGTSTVAGSSTPPPPGSTVAPAPLVQAGGTSDAPAPTSGASTT
jgi:hypothetical protein